MGTIFESVKERSINQKKEAVMKKNLLLLTATLMLLSIASLQPAHSQERSREDIERELREVKKFEDQKKMQEKEVQEAVTKAEDAASRVNELMRVYRGTGRSFNFSDPVVVATPGGVEFMHGFPFGSDSERTTWDFSRVVKGSTFSKSYSFDVEKSAKSVVMSVNGDCKSGEIRVNIILPGGKTYSDIVIDEYGNLNWRKSFSISEEENQDKTGEWTFKVSAKNATGQFRISLQSY